MFLVDKLFFVGKRMAVIAALGLLSYGMTPAVGAHSSRRSNTAMQPLPIPLNLTVNTLGDEADLALDGICDTSAAAGEQCTLRAAIQETNFTASDDTIGFSLAPNSNIILFTALPGIDDNLVINGPGANTLSVRRSSNNGIPDFRIFRINSGKTVTISGLSIINGRVNSGGGISNAGTLTVNSSSISDNLALNSGGGIANDTTSGPATLTINNSTIANNFALSTGGGIYNFSSANPATVNINNSTISINSANNSHGGGIYNSATGGGTATITINSSTITGNHAGSSGGSAAGGGIYNETTVTLNNTIVVGNRRSQRPSFPEDFAGYANPASSNNLLGVGNAGLSGGASGNQVNVADARLAPLDFNGGPTRTHALLADSPALDAGSNTLADNAGLTTDQRGFNRKVDGPDADATATVDIGAYESQASASFVNEPPSFTKGPDQTINEDAGPQTVNPWATGISPGPAHESGQTVTFQVTNNTNPILFAVQPAISPTGVLTYTPAANANGSADISIVLKDNGGVSDGGVDTSSAQTFKITVNAVNDAPTFTKGPDQVVPLVSGPQTVPNWASNISTGPADESGQTVNFIVTNNNNAFFLVQPAIDPSGTLTYTITPLAKGSAIVTVVLQDNGGTANGGQDTSAPQTFIITNDPKAWTTTGDSGVTEDENNPARPTYTNFTASANAGSPAGSYVLRYNITSSGDLTAVGATNTRLKVRFRDEGEGSRVIVAIVRASIMGGAPATLGTLFDSNTYTPGTGFQTQEILMPALTFDFTQNIYWLEVTLTKNSTSNQPGFGSAQIK